MWVVPTMGEVVAMQEPEAALVASASAEKEWRVAIATMTQLLSQCVQQDLDSADVCPMQGFILSGPIPLFNEPTRFGDLQSLVFTADKSVLQLPPSDHGPQQPFETTCQSVPLLPADPLSHEKFCLIQTSAFSWLAVLRHQSEGIQFQFSFNPETIGEALSALRSRIQLTRPHQIETFDALLTQFPVLTPDYRIPLQFSRHLLHTAVQAPFSRQGLERKPEPQATPEKEKARPEVELLQAIAHEVRTPLTTIQTFTRLLLKRSDLPGEVLQRLESIQRECRDQIDRFGLIFRAMEITNNDSNPVPTTLQPISLQQVLEENISRWQKQAARRDLSLSIRVPQQLPSVVISDPMMLDQVLTGLIDRLSHSLPSGSEIELQVAVAGEQLKLELRSHLQAHSSDSPCSTPTPTLKSVGHVLMVQPETGGLSLSLPVTKHLFEALGGKLSVRQHQQQGEVLTIFLPLGPEGQAY
ncbi:sensor histidine kinase [Acaryochloris thomasi]|nr:HAMP domain-containing sensor histidine kinase [Acaryochloris thomasi]